MFVRNITEVSTHIRVEPSFAWWDSKTKIPTGYAVLDENKHTTISVSLQKPDIINNQELIKQVQMKSLGGFDWAYIDSVNMYAYIPFTQYKEWKIYLEVINNFDMHKQRAVNYAFALNDLFLFTDVKAMDYYEGKLEWITKIDYINDWLGSLEVQQMDGRRNYGGYIPKKYVDYYPSNVHTQISSKLDYLTSFLILINQWKQTSFLKAHEYSTKLFQTTA